ncbi:glutathione S-transferase-like protein [Sphaerosporella brunnea]|uniref:Glutathione S-transferase-like protein n=1 Tax=Sphaerosporella brunnea TaxID=1250544 RepID=A0A5J5ER73_9PEZI|nr:glutathione S-transferase-like protein [Sphaerosporella brunnea]
MTSAPEYHLIYWRGIPGRGEFVRLAFEATGTAYIDTPGGNDEVVAALSESDYRPVPFAPPVLKSGDMVLGQTANILLFLGPRLGLVPDTEKGRLQVNQLALTALDLSDEANNVHHPIGVSLYYEDQKPEAARAAKLFREERMPKFFEYFEKVLTGNEWLVGDQLSYADLVLWQVVDGLKFAFPKASNRVLRPLASLQRHYERVKNIPNVKRYLESDRRQQYSMWIFRHYPELDDN